MNTLNRDILIGMMFLSGLWGFISAQFIFSTMMFAAAAIYSNISMRANA
jgi:hypothetical protein